MPRPKRKGDHLRIELHVDLADAAWREVVAEAERRNVTVQQHLHDLIRSRWLARQGETHMADLLWVPGDARKGTSYAAASDSAGTEEEAEQADHQPAPEDQADTQTAEEMKTMWLGLIDDTEKGGSE
jgi:hypothetical protein